MSTDKQNEANRVTARPSTGPLSLEGKNHSRRNALKSGLSSRGLILPENEARLAEARKRSFAASFSLDKPDGFSEVLLTQIAVESVRMERCQQEEQLIREHASEEAGALWHHERRIAACELGKTIHDDPEIVQLKLEMTYHGAEWLKGRWLILNMALETRGTWDAIEIALAQDLSGTPALLRESFKCESLEDRKTLVTKELDRLRTLSYERGPLDEKLQDLAEVGVSGDLDKRLKTLKRYETASRRAFDKSLTELRRHLNEIKSNVKEANGLGQSSKLETELYETNRLAVEAFKRWEEKVEAEAVAFLEEPARPAEPEPIAPAPIRLSSRPERQLNRKQRRKLAAIRRSA